MKKYLLLFLLLGSFTFSAHAQGIDCSSASPFCTGTTATFPASTSTTAGAGPNYGCLGSQPNPAWYFLQIDNSGQIIINMNNSAAVDIDFICWGPFTSTSAACASGLTGSAVDCSFSAAAVETCTIPSAVAGEVYVLLITNYSGMPTNISFADDPTSTGTTDCAILCNMTGLTAVVGACDPATNTYGLTGVITYSTPPTTGTLTVTNSCTGATQVFNAPFSATTTNYSLTGLPANGGPCTVTAVFSDDPACTMTTSFTAAASCAVICTISALTATPTACDSLTQQYSVSGNATFINAPSTGTLTITNSCGGTPVVLNPPFVSPAAYSFSGLTSNGASCSVTAVFSADAACTFTQAYTAPAPCLTVCGITGITATPTACTVATQQYNVSGNVSFVNQPSSGTLTITNSCGGTPVVLNAPFVSPAAYSFTNLPADSSNCNITAVFSADAACTFTQSYQAPPPCPPLCAISSVTSTASACDPSTNAYSDTGSVFFINPPSSGTLTITNSCGGTAQVFNAPFVSPIAYSFTGLLSNGSSCSVTAVFSASPSCTATQTYTAPAACVFCPVTASNNGPFCAGGTLQLNVTPIAGATYSWTGPNGFSDTTQNPMIPNVGNANTGTYTVTVTQTFPPCTSTDTTTFFLSPSPIISMSSDDVIYIGTTTQLYATGGGTYVWTPSSSLTCSTCDTTTASPSETTRYCVIVTGANGCIDSSCCTVEVKIPCVSNDNLEVPNAFTPNGDGINDELCLNGWESCISSFSMLVYDRWGAKVYETKDAGFCWDGKYLGKPLNGGVYVYFINATFTAEGATITSPKVLKTISRKGNFSLIR